MEELDLVLFGSIIRIFSHANFGSPCLGKATRFQCWGWPRVRGRLNIQKKYPSEIHPLVVVRCLVVDQSPTGFFSSGQCLSIFDLREAMSRGILNAGCGFMGRSHPSHPFTMFPSYDLRYFSGSLKKTSDR